MKNEVIINAANFKFSEFSNSVLQHTPEKEQDSDWFIKLREIDSKIHSHNLVEKINFTEDRLVLIAYKYFIETAVFDESPSLREWWVVKRYLEVYASQETPLINELRKVVNMYIGFTFSGAQMGNEEKTELKTFLTSLSKVVYEEGYIQLPQFVLDVIDGEEKPEKKKTKAAVEYNFTEDEASQWRGLRDTAKLMLEDTEGLTEEEIKNWEGALATSLIMLEE